MDLVEIGTIQVRPVVDGGQVIGAVELWNLAAELTGFATRSRRTRQSWHGFDADDWAGHDQFLDRHGRYREDMGGYLVTGCGDRVVLVDLGVGPEIALGGAFLDNLHRLGVREDDITDVVLTHLHSDHIGWASRDGRLTFPNATLHCHARDWEYFTSDAHDVVAGVSPDPARLRLMEPRIELWSADHTMFPGFDVLLSEGHTPGSSTVVLSSGARRAVLLGDAVHCPVELLDAEWAGLGDVDPDLAARTREALAREYDDGVTVVGAGHFPGLRFGRLIESEKGSVTWSFDHS